MRDIYIEIIESQIWNAALIVQEGEDEYARIFLENGFIQKLFEVIDILGPEVYEEYFDNLTTMISYAINALIFGVEEL